MRVILDAHLHGPYSRATSKDITIANLEKNARAKGLDVLGTGDFTHPKWLSLIKENLEEDGTGILRTKEGFPFILSVELSNIYTQGGRHRRVHNIILAPNLEVVGQINSALLKRGRLDYDGRPIFGFSCIELAEMMMGISTEIEIIPAHAWTSWYSIFGSKSGFDSIEECFGDQSKHIHAIETGLSSDPSMNWRISALDSVSLVSFSDAHSHHPWRLGREATVFELKELSYRAIINAIRAKSGIAETIEFYPEEGKYHLDGHRACNVVMAPEESAKHNKICPACRKELTIGVLHRIGQLADRPAGYTPTNAAPFRSLMPLSEIIAHTIGTGNPYSKSVWELYGKLIKQSGSEFKALLESPKEELEKTAPPKVADNIIKVRNGSIRFQPGYDGVYGVPIFDDADNASAETATQPIKKSQRTLGDF